MKCQQSGSCPESGGSQPCLINGRRRGQDNKQQGRNQARLRESWPRATSYQLFTPSVLLDRHLCPDGTVQTAPYLQVPTIKVTASPDHQALSAQSCFEGSQSFFGGPPALAPERRSLRPGKGEIRRSGPPPGRQTVTQATPQARYWLEQVQAGRYGMQLQPLSGGLGEAWKRSASCAQASLNQRHAHCQEEHG